MPFATGCQMPLLWPITTTPFSLRSHKAGEPSLSIGTCMSPSAVRTVLLEPQQASGGGTRLTGCPPSAECVGHT
jgi:hypothetical protein